MPTLKLWARRIASFLFKAAFYLINGYLVFFLLSKAFEYIAYSGGIAEFFQEFFSSPVVVQAVLLTLLVLPIISLFIPAIVPKFKTARGLFQYVTTIELPIIIGIFLFAYGYDSSTSDRFSATILILVSSLFITSVLSLIPERLTTKLMAIIFFVQAFLASVVGYFALLYLFFLVPMLLEMPSLFIDSLSSNQSVFTVVTVVATLWLLLSLFIFLWITVGLPYLLVRWLWRRTHHFYSLTAAQTGVQRAKLLLSISVMTVVIVWGIASLQLEKKYLALLENYTQLETFEEKQSIARELQTYKFEALQELSYLTQAQKTYPFDADFSSFDALYSEYNLPESTKSILDSLFRIVAKPYIYKYSFSDSYTSHASAVKEILNYDLRSQQDLSLDTDHQRNLYSQVSLTSRTVSASTQQEGRLALVTVTETFRNNSSGDLETISDFILPAGSVVVDLKLGLNLEFPGLIAPRGAARKTYEAELRQRRDPALLQQVGPDQYKLRVFPVPGNGTQKVQYTYVTALTPSGFGLPSYMYENGYKAESSNFSDVKLNATTAITNSGGRFLTTQHSFCDLQDASTGTQNQSFMIATLASSTRFCTQPGSLTPFDQLMNKQIALVLDVSIVNKDTEYLQKLKNFFRQNPDILANNTIVLYQVNKLQATPIQLTNSTYETVLNQVIWFGQGTFDAQLAAVPTTVDAVIYVTTNEFMDPASDTIAAKLELLPPVHIVYPELKNGPAWRSSYYDAFFGKELTAHDSIEEAWLTMVVQEEIQSDGVVITPYWQVTALSDSDTLLGRLAATPTRIETIATDFPELYRGYYALRQNMDAAAQGINLSRPEQAVLATLDSLTAQAEQLHVVTPLTSLVALVNQTQVDRLEQNTQLDDRYSAPTETTGRVGDVSMQRFSGPGGISNPAIGTVTPGRGFSSAPSMGPLGALGGSSNFGAALDSAPSDIGLGEVGRPVAQTQSSSSTIVGVILILLAVGIMGYVGYRFASRKKASQE